MRVLFRSSASVAAAISCFVGSASWVQAQVSARQVYTSNWYQVGAYKVPYAYYAINLNVAQAAGYTGKGITVAVFDTGLNVTNTKFAGNMVTGFNIFGNNGAGSVGVTTDNGGSHGTFVSGIIAANLNVTTGLEHGFLRHR